jgi:cell division protein FtsI (penicillin-binding protein 3)
MNSFDTSLCLRLMLTFAHFLWQGTLVLIVVFGVKRLLGKSSATVRYNFLVAALLVMVACPAITLLSLKAQSAAPPLAGHNANTGVAAEGQRHSIVLPGGWTSSLEPASIEHLQPARAASPTISRSALDHWQRYAPHAVTCYLLGVCLMSVRLLLALRGGTHLQASSIAVQDDAILRSVARQARVIGLLFTPAVAQCREVIVPAVVGVVRPMILLPIQLTTQLTSEQIDMLLAHELAHIKRFDHLVNLLQRIVEAALFFHPAVWVLSRWIRVEREHCCDDLVVRAGNHRFAYAESLVRVAELSMLPRLTPAVAALTLGASGHNSQLWNRVSRLLGDAGREQLHLQQTWMLAVVLVTASVLSVSVLASQDSSREAKATAQQHPAASATTFNRGEILDRTNRPLARSTSPGNTGRGYPMGTLAAHLIGRLGPDGKGISGVELQYNGVLEGAANARVILTLDADVQKKLEEQLAERVQLHEADSAIGVVVKIKTGEILAMGNYPTFDPAGASAASAEILRNRVLTDAVEPGSVFKPAVMATILANHAATRDEMIDCHNGLFAIGSRTIHDAQPYKMLSVDGILANSSNIGMAILCQRLSNATLQARLSDFGFGEKTGIDLPGEEPGLMLPVDKWTKTDAISMSMGQSVAVTPIQLITAFATICNGGRLMRPHVVAAIEDNQGRTIEDHRTPQVRREVLEPDVADSMVKMLTKVCTEGTGKECKLEHWQALGKTGTAQLPRTGQGLTGYEPGAYLASFIGAAPASNPEVAVLIMTRHPRKNGYYGAVVALPGVKEVLNFTLSYLNVPHDLPKAL